MKSPARLLALLTSFLVLLGLFLTLYRPAAAQANPTAQALLEEIDRLRSEQDLPAFTPNSVLMEVAQNHSRYQASLGVWTHIGAGGTTPLQRAQAAGYGLGMTVACVENVTFGYQWNAARALEAWSGQEDQANLLSLLYFDIGVGAYTAENGNTFYTFMACSSTAQALTPTNTPAGEIVWGVSTTTPEPDGAIYHIVQEGQALESIARAYGVNLADLRALNNLQPNQGLFIGDVLLIRPAHTPTPTLELPPSPTPITLEATATLRPTRTPFTPQPTVVQATRTPAPTPTSRPFEWILHPQVGNTLLVLVFVSAGLGAVLIIYGLMLRRK
jgi:LysM repeat protein